MADQPCATFVINHVHAYVECKRQVHLTQTFSKFGKKSNSYCKIWNQYEKCIQMSTNKPSIGPVVLEKAF